MARVIALGADHGGFPLKLSMAPWLESQGYQVLDMGAHSLDPADDYPDFAAAVAQAVVSGQAERGIVICGSGVGASVVANKIPGIRASVCHDLYSARQGVEHDELNVLSLGARVVGLELAQQLIAEFLDARFTGEERHVRRLAKINAIEQNSRQG
ncbi:MAG: ribose 5-phosphate isomerase B [SAR202 cluster bacterium Io17-Chloro-G4]|nr:MAG: ribose 5-phosphate isomerase B [SAR202 cluster bacterium Io17-Chloro-G4]